MTKLKQMLLYLVITALTFYILPLFGKDTGSYMLILLIGIPLLSFIVAFIYGAKRGFGLYYPIIVALLFIPTIFIYYNSSAWIYAVVYAIITLIGSAIGGFFIHGKETK